MIKVECPYCYIENSIEGFKDNEEKNLICTNCQHMFRVHVRYVAQQINEENDKIEMEGLVYYLEYNISSIRDMMLGVSDFNGDENEKEMYDYFIQNLKSSLEVGYRAVVSIRKVDPDFDTCKTFNPENLANVQS